eukprot:m.168970 g.168970  ORF g.168970 m.168970 type:complete len:274 (-) comp17229_c1_seq3:3769-4590(-)
MHAGAAAAAPPAEQERPTLAHATAEAAAAATASGAVPAATISHAGASGSNDIGSSSGSSSCSTASGCGGYDSSIDSHSSSMAEALLRCFPEDELVQRCERVSADDVPEPSRRLLAHHTHMTMTMEAHHACAMQLQVIRTVAKPELYVRQVLLRRSSDGRAAMFGIARVHLEAFPESAQRDILAQKIPLGHIMQQHAVKRRVELRDLYLLVPGPALSQWLYESESDKLLQQQEEQQQQVNNSSSSCSSVVYGRTAMIHCNDQPGIELLEVVIAP